MAEQDQQSTSQTQPDNQDASSKLLDHVLTGLVVVAGIGGLVGFAAIFSLWWGNEITDPQDILRIASKQYIEGNTTIAGDLAESVRFDTDPALTGDDLAQAGSSPEDLLPEESVEASPALMTEAEKLAKEQAEEEKQAWIRVRDFLVGAGKYTRALKTNEVRQRRKLFREAVRPLSAAARAGYPPGRETEGAKMLGESFYHLGQFRDAADAFLFALDRDPTLDRDLLPMLAKAQLHLPSTPQSNAVNVIDRYLSIAGLTPTERAGGEIIRLRGLVQAGRYDEVESMVQQIMARDWNRFVKDEGKRQNFLHRLRLQDAIAQAARGIDQYGTGPNGITEHFQQARAAFEPTIEKLEQLDREASPEVALIARIWKARLLCCLGDFENGIAEFTGVRQSRPLKAAAILGGVEELEWLARRGDGSDFVLTIRYLIRELGDSNGFDTRLISLVEFRRRVLEAIGQLRARKDFTNAIDAARSLPPVFDMATALTQEGLGYRQWAENTIADGTNISGEVSRSASKLARTRYRAAGDAFAAAAKEQFDTRDYVPKLWSAIEAYQEGRHFRRSIDLLQNYERYEERTLIPRALIALGRALLAEGDIEHALGRLETCIAQYPRDPSIYDARLLTARAFIEQEEFDLARQHLIDNLHDENLTPESPVWRESLYTLGDMLFQRASQNHLAAEATKAKELQQERFKANQPTIEEAIGYLDQAVGRYFGKSNTHDPAARAESAAYLASRARVMASKWPLLESRSPDILESARRSLRAKGEEELNIALAGFARLKDHLARLEEERRLSPKAEGLLRNCYMAKAQTLQAMDQLEEAAAAYRDVESRYANEPLALEAIMSRVSCAKQLGQDEKANLLVKQAQLVLGRIPAEMDPQFEKTTRFDRDGWTQYLGWISQRVSTNPDAQRR